MQSFQLMSDNSATQYLMQSFFIDTIHLSKCDANNVALIYFSGVSNLVIYACYILLCCCIGCDSQLLLYYCYITIIIIIFIVILLFWILKQLWHIFWEPPASSMATSFFNIYVYFPTQALVCIFSKPLMQCDSK